MHLWIILCCLAILHPAVGHAEPLQPLVQNLSSGEINWTTSTLTAKGSFKPDIIGPNASQNGHKQAEFMLLAYRKATENLLQTLEQVRIDADHCVSDVMAANVQIKDKILQMCKTADQTNGVQLPDGTIEVSVQMNLLGSFMQLMLPEGIRQVESIKPMNEPVNAAPSQSGTETQHTSNDEENGYTGLVVDARGIGAKPSMVPVIVDESGKQVYGSIFISREYAVQYGVCIYVRDIKATTTYARIAPKPLIVKGLRTTNEHQTDIVISNADAAKLRDASANLNFLKQCRVLIISD